MKPPKTSFVCQECGAQSPKWLGRCPDCGAWNSLVEERVRSAGGRSAGAVFDGTEREGDALCRRRSLCGDAAVERASTSWIACWAAASCRVRWCYSAVSRGSANPRCSFRRRRTSRGQSGQCSTAPARNPNIRSSHVGSGWASVARRSTCWPKRASNGFSRSGTAQPALIVVDSIQTVFSLKLQSAPGSIGQVRESATQLLFAAKGQNVPTFLVGHVTKDGSLAGPKALEHVVDTVLYFEGERHHAHRVVRAVKNRFGAISELGVFEMTGDGLVGARIPRRCSWRNGRWTRQDPPCCAASRGRVPCSSKCRRSSAAARSATRAAWPAASTATGCRCCSRYSRSAPDSISPAKMCSSTLRAGISIDEPAVDLSVAAAVASSLGTGRSRRRPPSSVSLVLPERCAVHAGGTPRPGGRAAGLPPLRAAPRESRIARSSARR